jgi:hypothetical protein
MYGTGQLELQSTAWLNKSTHDRPSFMVTRRGMFGGPRPFQVFALPTGLLFLELKNKVGVGNGPNGAVVAGAVLAGPLGALMGAAIANNCSGPAEQENGFDLYDEDQLFELAGSRKRSFVAKKDEIKWISLDPAGFMDRTFTDSSLVGWMTLSDRCLGKVTLGIHNQLAMSVAVEAFPKRFGDRVQVNVALDERTMRFVPKRG